MLEGHYILGFPSSGSNSTDEYIDTLWNIAKHDARCVDYVRMPGPLLAQNRNAIVRAFLAHERTPEWLLMVDNDEAFPTWGPLKAMEVARKVGARVLGCAVTLSSYYEGFFKKHENGGYMPLQDLEVNRIYRRLDAVGTGFLLVHREVFEKMALKYPRWAPWFWYDLAIINGEEEPLGEDMSFCRRAQDCGYTITGFTGIPVVHYKKQALLAKFMAPLLKNTAANMKLAESWR